MVQFSHLYMTTGKKKHSFDEVDISQQNNVCFLIQSLDLSELSFQGAASFNFMAADTVQSDLGAPKLKFATVSIPPPPSICHEVMGLDVNILVF